MSKSENVNTSWALGDAVCLFLLVKWLI